MGVDAPDRRQGGRWIAGQELFAQPGAHGRFVAGEEPGTEVNANVSKARIRAKSEFRTAVRPKQVNLG